MKTYDHKFSENEIEKLRSYRDSQKDDSAKQRFEALLAIALYPLGIESGIKYAASVFGKCIITIRNWLNKYLTEGVEKLNSYDYKSKKSYLNRYEINQVIIYVTFENPNTSKEVKDYIEQKFGIIYSVDAVRKILLKNGMKVMRPKLIPGNPPTPDEQKKIIEEYHVKRQETDSVLLFCDVFHLIHQNFPGICWGNPAFRPIAETNTGRQRLNILGSLEPGTLAFTHLTGEENCNAERVIEFLEKIHKKYANYSNIYMKVDNATYFHSKKVSEWLEEHMKIKLEFLPPYAPNLNLIERFWRFAKKKLVRSKYYKEYKIFRAAAFRFFNHVNEYVDEFKTLMVEKFQIIYA